MDISDVRIKLVSDSSDRLKAFCSVTLEEEFVVRDIKIVEGSNGLFVAMPSRKLSASCPECRHKNPLRARYCSDCGAGLPSQEVQTDDAGRAKLYRDIAHPITPAFREKLQTRVVEAYQDELEEAPDSDEPATGDYEAEEHQDLDHDRGGGEYADIIADLRSPGGTEQSGVQDRDQDRPQPSSERPEGDRPKRRRRRGRGRGPRSDEETPKPAPEPAASTEAVAEEDEEISEPVSTVQSSLEVAEEREAPPSPVETDHESDEVSLSEAAESPAPSLDASEDTTPFGAGIT